MTKTKKTQKTAAQKAAAPTLAITLGCPAGVGPEVALGAYAAHRATWSAKPARARATAPRLLFVGDANILAEAARVMGVDDAIRVCTEPAEVAALAPTDLAVWGPSARVDAAFVAGEPNAACGAAQLAWIDAGLELVRRKTCAALVTGPASKAAIASSGAPGAKSFRGHTEHLAAKLGAALPVMAFVSPALVTALVTTHLPLSKVPRAITEEGVAAATVELARLCERLEPGSTPTIAVTSLNPHAGEDDLLGREERAVITPGIERARRALAKARSKATVVGPLGAETAFRRAVREGRPSFDGVVAMYHDQATIASKVLSFGEAVNVTLGLPIVRTSVDHGTGYDIAWTGKADPAGMIAAIELATRLLMA